jgi:hypothetical protein
LRELILKGAEDAEIFAAVAAADNGSGNDGRKAVQG